VNLAVRQPCVVVVDDDPFVRLAWEQALDGVQVAVFGSPSEILRRIAQGGLRLEDVACVVTDLVFDGAPANGIDLARFLRAAAPDLPLILSTDASSRHVEALGGAAAFRTVIGKTVLEAPELFAHVGVRCAPAAEELTCAP
jgi:CheY-like chemotaxis protein